MKSATGARELAAAPQRAAGLEDGPRSPPAEERAPTQERPDTSTRSEGGSGVSSGASGRYLTTGGLGLNSDLEGLRCCRGGA